MNWNDLAERSIDGGALTREECRAVLRSPDSQILDLLGAAYRVRRHFHGVKVQIHVLTNAKSGLCPEDCHYCSQSAVSNANIKRYGLMSVEELEREAERAVGAQSRRFCMVMSGRGPSDAEVDRLCEATRRIKAKYDLDICCSVGLIEPGQAAKFKEAGVDRINHNLNTSERHHPNICTTHTYEDRMTTLKTCREAGLQLCSGAIFGQGEEDEDVIDVVSAFREIGMESIPINFLIPIKGTPFGEQATGLSPLRCLKMLCLARFMNPTREIRVAGGREVHLKSLQPMALYAANSIFVQGYLTEPGQATPDAWRMIEDLGFTVEMTSGEGTVEREVASVGVPN